jgi:polysaccharide biosynthesis transport protein
MEAPKTTSPNQFQPPAQQATDNKLHFLDYWRIIRIRKTVILAVFLLVVITTTAVTFILPESYMSMARIEVSKDVSDISPLMPTAQQGQYDPYFLQTEFEKIRSQWVLNRVVENLKLNDVWTKRYHAEGNSKLPKLISSFVARWTCSRRVIPA